MEEGHVGVAQKGHSGQSSTCCCGWVEKLNVEGLRKTVIEKKMTKNTPIAINKTRDDAEPSNIFKRNIKKVV